MHTGINPGIVISVINASKAAADVNGATQGSENFNRLYVQTCWNLGLKVGKKAAAKFAKENPGVQAPKGRKLSYNVPGSAGDVASALASAINSLAPAKKETKESAPVTGKEKAVPTTQVVRALPTLIVEMNGGEKAVYGKMRAAIRNGATTAQAVGKVLSPESQGTLALMVQQGAVASDSIPGLTLSVS